MEGSLEVQELWECLGQLKAGAEQQVEVQQGATEAEKAQAEAERQHEEWLANEAASGCRGVMYWVWQHHILLNGVSATHASIQNGLVQMPKELPLELEQGFW
ncbi:hypothetical protein C0989_006373 [Termitomyces sp. Mn162]|nr:hypothetical protein C0989_006373 [Termitomyces sp. Mn162]